MEYFKRVFLIVLDSVGIGAAPDAKLYGDEGANTLGHIAEAMGGLYLPQLERLGLGNIAPIRGVRTTMSPQAFYTKMVEASIGKDTMTGHWELMGLHISQPFQTFPNGFPRDLISKIEAITNRNVIGNKVASGTEIIDKLGAEHITSGAIIVYTSADSVLQIAAHEDIVPLEELYDICKKVRKLTLKEPYRVGRVIARPFVGDIGTFNRTPNRYDYAVKPFAPTVLNYLQEGQYDVISIGKIVDIFAGEGITQSIKTTSNDDGIEKLTKMMTENFHGLCFVNLVDFDALYGHRRNPIGYGQALERFDQQLEQLLPLFTKDDLLIITADHGNDPTYEGTDHTREYVPLLVYTPRHTVGSELTVRKTFADVGATIAENFNVQNPKHGMSFLFEIQE